MREKNQKPEDGSMGNAGQEDRQDKRTCPHPAEWATSWSFQCSLVLKRTALVNDSHRWATTKISY